MASRINGKNPQKKPHRPLGRGLVPGNPGNSGGKPGRSGRKPLAFSQECEHLVDTAVLKRVGDYLEDEKHKPDDPAWRWCAEYVTKYTKSEPKRALELSGKIPVEFTFDLSKASARQVEDV